MWAFVNGTITNYMRQWMLVAYKTRIKRLKTTQGWKKNASWCVYKNINQLRFSVLPFDYSWFYCIVLFDAKKWKIELSLRFAFNHIQKKISPYASKQHIHTNTEWRTEMKYHFSTFNSPFFRHARFELSARFHFVFTCKCMNHVPWSVLLLMLLFQHTSTIHTSYMNSYTQNHENLLQFTCTLLRNRFRPSSDDFYFFFPCMLLVSFTSYIVFMLTWFSLCLSVKRFFLLLLLLITREFYHQEFSMIQHNGLMFVIFHLLSHWQIIVKYALQEIVPNINRSWTSNTFIYLYRFFVYVYLSLPYFHQFQPIFHSFNSLQLI